MKKKLKPPSPADHPATYGSLSVGAIAAFIALEAQYRLGVSITPEEAGIFVSACIALFHFAQGKVKR